MFRPYKVILKPSKKTDPSCVYVSVKRKQILDIIIIILLFYYACPITLGNTTCWVIIGCPSGSILRCVTLHCSELIWFRLCYSKSKSIDSIKVMNGFWNFVINSCLLVGQCSGWMMFFFRVPLCFARSLHWYNRWSTVWSPCLQTHVALSSSLNWWIRLFGGPEDDPIRSKHVTLTKYTIFVYK